MLVGAAVVLVSQQQGAIGHAVGRIAQRSLQVRLGLAYPLARRFRTSMTLGMFALVVFILVYVSVIGSMFSGQLGQFTRDASGGFNVLVSSNPSDPGAVRRARAASPACTGSRRSCRWTSRSCARPGSPQAAQWSGERVRPVARAARAADARRSRRLRRPTAPRTRRCSPTRRSRSSTSSSCRRATGRPRSRSRSATSSRCATSSSGARTHVHRRRARRQRLGQQRRAHEPGRARKPRSAARAVPSRAYVDVTEPRSVRLGVRRPVPRERRAARRRFATPCTTSSPTSSSSSC